MSKWKLEIKAPFLGIAPDSHRNITNDYWGTYGEPNQSQTALGALFDCSNPNYLSPTPRQYDVTGASTTDLIKYITDYTIPYQSIYENAYAIGNTNLYALNTAGGVYVTHAVTNMTDGQSLGYHGNVLYYFYNTSSAGDIGTFNLNATYDDDWGSTTPTGHAALEKAIHPVTTYKNNVIFGNGRYLGKITDGTTLVPKYIDYGVGSLVSDVAVTGSYLYVAVTFPALGTKKRSVIYKYDALLTETDPLDGINVKLEITALRAMNGVVYVFYGDSTYLNPIEGFIGYISGSQVVLLRTYKGRSPKFNQVTEHRGYIAFMDSYGGTVYLYGQYDIGSNNILMPYCQSSNTSVGALASPFNGLMFSGMLATVAKFYRLPYAADLTGNYYQYCDWMSVAQIVGDSLNDSIIDNITVFTNVLGASAGVTLMVRYPASNLKILEITGTGKSKHIFRNIDIPADMFALHLDWRDYSEVNPCLIKKIIVNGHTRTK